MINIIDYCDYCKDKTKIINTILKDNTNVKCCQFCYFQYIEGEEL